MSYALLALIVLGLIRYALTRVAKQAVVSPVGEDGVLKEARLTQKMVYQVLIDDYGIPVSFLFGFMFGIVLCWAL